MAVETGQFAQRAALCRSVELGAEIDAKAYTLYCPVPRLELLSVDSPDKVETGPRFWAFSHEQTHTGREFRLRVDRNVLEWVFRGPPPLS